MEQQQFFLPKPAEQLFDISQDPYEVNDLSKNRVFHEKLMEMRTKLSKKVKEVNDLSFYPESYMIDNALLDPISFGKKRSDEIAKLVDISDLALLSFQEAENQLKDILSSGTEWEKYWACLVAAKFGGQAKSLHAFLPDLLKHPNLMVQLRAVEAWALISQMNPMPKLIEITNASQSRIEVLLTLNSVTFFRDHRRYGLDPSLFTITAPKGEFSRRLEYFVDSKDALK